jgi:hypothetical protein
VLAWDAPADAGRVEVTRSARRSTSAVRVYRGTGSSYTDSHLRNGVRYRYEVTVLDAAGNAATATVTAVPTAPLFQPVAGARVSAPPLLAWKAVPHATYYNVQLWRGGKIFSAWPTATRLRLPRSWTYEGRRHRLTPGQYRWYVWPGFGARSGHRYGRLLGGSSFVVVSGGRG